MEDMEGRLWVRWWQKKLRGSLMQLPITVSLLTLIHTRSSLGSSLAVCGRNGLCCILASITSFLFQQLRKHTDLVIFPFQQIINSKSQDFSAVLDLPQVGTLARQVLGVGSSSAMSSICCSYRRPRFSSQHPYWAAHNLCSHPTPSFGLYSYQA